MERDWISKFESGEYLHEYAGFSPYWIGCFYGDSVCLGGEDEFTHCYDFFSGIGDVEWWIKPEIDALTDEQRTRLIAIMDRNKKFKEEILTRVRIEALAKYFGCNTHVLYRMGSRSLYRLMKVLNDNFNDIIEENTRSFNENRRTKKICDLFDYNEKVIRMPILD